LFTKEKLREFYEISTIFKVIGKEQVKKIKKMAFGFDKINKLVQKDLLK